MNFFLIMFDKIANLLTFMEKKGMIVTEIRKM